VFLLCFYFSAIAVGTAAAPLITQILLRCTSAAVQVSSTMRTTSYVGSACDKRKAKNAACEAWRRVARRGGA